MEDAGAEVRIGVDIGGTFTDIVLERGPERISAKVLTTSDAPEVGVREGLTQAMESCGAAPDEVALVIHGTTLATNALIERKGARTALVTTEGFRDSIEMGTESRFEQYDIDMEKPVPLVPRQWRFPIPERLNAAGDPILALDEAAVEDTAARLAAEGIESAAIGLLHSYVNPAHERRVRAILQAALPELAITLSSEVRAGDARVRAFLHRLRQRLRAAGHGALPAQPGGGPARRRLPLPALRHALGRRRRRHRDGDPLPHPSRRIRAGGRRRLREPRRPPMRAGPRALLRHGRHHRQDLPDRRRPAADDTGFRGRARPSLPQGQRAAAPHPP